MEKFPNVLTDCNKPSAPLSKLPTWKYEVSLVVDTNLAYDSATFSTLVELILYGYQPTLISESKPTSTDTSALSHADLDDLVKLMDALNLQTYQWRQVSNLNDASGMGRRFFDFGLRLMFSYQHELAARYFGACILLCPHAALAHGLLALCHGPNYNFQGAPYYGSSFHEADLEKNDANCVFPSQHVADRHSAAAIHIVEELKIKTANDSGSEMISALEDQFLEAIRLLTGSPGVDPETSYETVGRPYADAMRNVYQAFPLNPEVAYFFVESLMVLNAWQLYAYPSGLPLSTDVVEIRKVLEQALLLHPNHPGLCHKYIHLIEMSAYPEDALAACEILRSQMPHAGHLVHMPTHIDVLVGDYENCIRYNLLAIDADLHLMKLSPSTAGRESFYFNYTVVRCQNVIAIHSQFGYSCLIPCFAQIYSTIFTCLSMVQFLVAWRALG